VGSRADLDSEAKRKIRTSAGNQTPVVKVLNLVVTDSLVLVSDNPKY